jgi:hypothetical protein
VPEIQAHPPIPPAAPEAQENRLVLYQAPIRQLVPYQGPAIQHEANMIVPHVAEVDDEEPNLLYAFLNQPKTVSSALNLEGKKYLKHQATYARIRALLASTETWETSLAGETRFCIVLNITYDGKKLQLYMLLDVVLKTNQLLSMYLHHHPDSETNMNLETVTHLARVYYRTEAIANQAYNDILLYNRGLPKFLEWQVIDPLVALVPNPSDTSAQNHESTIWTLKIPTPFFRMGTPSTPSILKHPAPLPFTNLPPLHRIRRGSM